MDSTVPLGKRLRGELTPPCSKSYAQRALAVALLANGRTTLRGIELCRDTRSAIDAIRALGANVEIIDDNTIAVDGGFAPTVRSLSVGESGLAARLFTPIAALASRPITIEGEGTLCHRPMAMMVEPLKELGVEVRDGGGRLPIEVCGPLCGGRVKVDGSISSQFITGLLLALPRAAPYADYQLHSQKVGASRAAIRGVFEERVADTGIRDLLGWHACGRTPHIPSRGREWCEVVDKHAVGLALRRPEARLGGRSRSRQRA